MAGYWLTVSSIYTEHSTKHLRSSSHSDMYTKAIFLFATLLVEEAITKPSYTHDEHSYSHDDHDHLRYHGPTAIPHVLHNGHIEDTHEVASAKAEHLSAVAKVSTHGGYGSDYGHGENNGDEGQYAYSHAQQEVFSHDDHDHLRYHGPTAIPHVLHNGHIADTHEVAAAKAEHISAVAKAYTHGGSYKSDYSGQHAGEHHEHLENAQHYHGPLAKPVVLKSGYLADTHEVAAAKEHHLEAVHSNHHGHYHH